MIETKKSFCRFCHVFCGVEVDVEDNRVVAVRGDRDNVITRGYTCQKGRAEVERIHHPDRLLEPRKRVGERFESIPAMAALDEIAEKLRGIVDRHGPESVAVYVGCGGHRTSIGGPWFVRRWLDALGSTRLYTSFTIDSPSLTIAGNRFFGGPLPANIIDLARADVAMFVGTNPITSHQLNMPQSNPTGQVNDAVKRGMKIIVIDPRRSDVARRADVHLQVKPGEDSTLLAGIVKVILDRGLEDKAYCADFVSGVAELHEAVADFDLEYVAARTDVPSVEIEKAAVLFASAKTGGAISGTGMHMAAHHNLATQLVMTLNGLCGRYDRVGGMCRNEGPLGRRFDSSMSAFPMRELPKSRIRDVSTINGLFGSYLEWPTNTLTDEMLEPGPGQIKALIVNGGNPALVFSNERATQRALDGLELLVANDLFMSATAARAHYVMAVKHPFERVDVPKLMDGTFPMPFSQYTPALVDAPAECLEEWQIFWGLAERLGLPLRSGSLHAADGMPDADAMLDAMTARGRVSMDEIRKHPSGAVFGEPEMVAGGVIPNMIAHEDKRMAAGHPEVLRELAEVRGESVATGGGYANDESEFSFRLITYRMKEVYCTQGQNLPSLRAKRATNPVLIHPEVMSELGLTDGDLVEIESDFGRVEGVAEASDAMRKDVIACAFGWGDPSDARGVREKGCNVQRLIPADHRYDPVTGLALQSAIPVNLAATTH